MRQAAMPGNDEQLIAGENIPDDIGIRKNRAQHEGPGDDSAAVHRMRGKHVLAAKNCLPDQCAGDAVCDGVHRSVLADGDQRVGLGDDFADAESGDSMSAECGNGRVSKIQRDRDQQAAGSLRIEEQVAVFLRDG